MTDPIQVIRDRQTEGEPLTAAQLRLLADELGLVVMGKSLVGAGVVA